MNIIKSIILVIVLCGIINVFRMQDMMFIPIVMAVQTSPIMTKLAYVGVSGNDKLVRAIHFAATENEVSPDFIIALTYTESNFKEKAVSSKGYNGLMQIRYPIFKPDANILIGTDMFKQKMAIAHNDVVKAICLYKGYEIGSKKGLQEAKKVLKLYKELQEIKA